MKKFKEIYKNGFRCKVREPFYHSDSVAGHARLGLKWDWLLNVLWQWHNPRKAEPCLMGIRLDSGGR